MADLLSGLILDDELVANMLSRKEALREEHTRYLRQHPELKQILNDFVNDCLLRRPTDVIQHAADYFSVFRNTFIPPPSSSTHFRPLVICGPTGVGKSLLITKLTESYPGDFGFPITHTSRAPRAGEEDGVHFHFSTEEAIKDGASKGKFVEAQELGGNWYGTSVAAIADVVRSGRVCVIETDVEGVLAIKKTTLNARFLFIKPPTVSELERRIRAAGKGTSDSDLAARIERGKRELKFIEQTDLWDRIVENNQLDAALAELKEVVEDDLRVRHAHVAQQAKLAPKNSQRPIAFAGPSGVGKGTLIEMLMKEFPDTFGFAVSTTTRNPRPKEIDGQSYHFTNVPAFKADIAAGKFVEYAEVHGNFYGTSYASVETVFKSGKVCIMDKDVQGIIALRKTDLNPRTIFIRPPSMEALEQRIRGRGTETEETLARRLQTAKSEMAYVDRADLWDNVILNDNLDDAYTELKRILKPEITAKKK